MPTNSGKWVWYSSPTPFFLLSHGCLAEWFRLLASNPAVADLYTSSSFLAATGFRPALVCLERLSAIPSSSSVTLPEDFFQNPEAFKS